MSNRTHTFALLLCLAAASLSGCHRNIVRAAPPSVITPPPPDAPPQTTAPVTAAEMPPVEPPEVTPEAVPAPPIVQPAQPRPRPPVEPEPPKPKAEPEPEPPQIAPQLSPRQLANAQRETSADIVAAEKNLQLVNGKQLNATQNDLVEKIRGFLGQAHDAIRTSDWVRAQNLARKAQILSGELAKSL